MKKWIFISIWFLVVSVMLVGIQGGWSLDSFKKPEPPLEKVDYHPYSHLEGYDDILKLQLAFIRNAKIIKPKVVSINSLKELPSPTTQGNIFKSEPKNWLPGIKRWLNNNVRRRYQIESLGSGVFFDARGYILTNHHVIEDTKQLLVKLPDKREFNAKVIGVDPMTDLAVLKIFSVSSFQVPQFGTSDDIAVGNWVMAIGNPYGLEGTVTVGVISGVGRSDLGIATYENFIQTDASINPGNSGGPLINLDGEIVGINTAIAELGSGVGFAIPIKMALEVAESLIEKGEVERGWLGVGIQPLTPELAASFKVSKASWGVVVNSIDKGAPADEAGILRGDIIVNYDGKAVSDLKSLQRYVADTEIGKSVPIKIVRDGREKMIVVKVGKLDS